MNKFLRYTSLAATVAALSLTSAPAFAAGSEVKASPQASANVRILKPLSLAGTQNLDLGTVALGQGTFSTLVGIDQTGKFTCDALVVTCSGTPKVAKYLVNGTNNRSVKIAAADVTMSNGSVNLVLDVDAPTSVTLPNSGTAGKEFSIGGAVTLTEATPDGVYTGTFAVTADYE